MKNGDKVTIRNTMLYNGRHGVIQNPEVRDPSDPWDYNVLLDDGRLIGVEASQVYLTDLFHLKKLFRALEAAEDKILSYQTLLDLETRNIPHDLIDEVYSQVMIHRRTAKFFEDQILEIIGSFNNADRS